MGEPARKLDPELEESWSACQEGFRPDSPQTTTQWADEKRFLSAKGAAEPGKWYTSRTPYLREIMDAVSAMVTFTRVVVKKGSQVGVTEVALNLTGETVDRRRVSLILLLPNIEPVGKKFVKQKLDPLLEETPCLRGKVRDKRARDSGNSAYMKEFPGGFIMVAGANSPAGLRSAIAGILVADEVDSYVASAGKEGDPITLAERALRSYGRRKKILEISTPLLDGTSRITRDFEACDVTLALHVPCPFCNAMQVLAHEQLEWPDGEPQKAKFRCVACAVLIGEEHKTWMLARYEWRIQERADDQDLDDAAPTTAAIDDDRDADGDGDATVAPALLEMLARAGIAPVLIEAMRRGAKAIGFDLPAYYSPEGWFTWVDCAELYEKAKLDPDVMQIYDNTVRGVAHKRSTDAPDHLRLYERREAYPIGVVPPQGLFLTAGVDVQRAPARVEWEIVAWARGKESWSVDYGVIDGSIADPRVGRELDEVLGRDVPCAGGGTLPIRVLGIDSGWDAQNVYAWARRHVQPAYGATGASCRAPHTVAVVKGRDHGLRLVWSTSRDDLGGKRRGVRIYQVSSYQALTELYTWLRFDAPTNEDLEKGITFPPGYCHFPDYGVEYFKQLVAEVCVTHTVHGQPRETFELPKGRRNEAADCRKYARAAAELYGISRFRDRDWRELELARGVVHGEEQPRLPLDAKYATPPAVAHPREAAPPPVATPVARPPLTTSGGRRTRFVVGGGLL